jgi:hypothetical protein
MNINLPLGLNDPATQGIKNPTNAEAGSDSPHLVFPRERYYQPLKQGYNDIDGHWM